MKAILTGCTAVLLAVSQPAAVSAQTRVGVLTCNVEGGAGFIVGSSYNARCVFQGNGRSERYMARLSRVGLDVGYTGRAVLSWAVIAPSDSLSRRALRGTYAGASADVAAGVGGGVNLLIGGSNRTISLQPLSVQAETGVKLGLGFGQLELL